MCVTFDTVSSFLPFFITTFAYITTKKITNDMLIQMNHTNILEEHVEFEVRDMLECPEKYIHS